MGVACVIPKYSTNVQCCPRSELPCHLVEVGRTMELGPQPFNHQWLESLLVCNTHQLCPCTTNFSIGFLPVPTSNQKTHEVFTKQACFHTIPIRPLYFIFLQKHPLKDRVSVKLLWMNGGNIPYLSLTNFPNPRSFQLGTIRCMIIRQISQSKAFTLI